MASPRGSSKAFAREFLYRIYIISNDAEPDEAVEDVTHLPFNDNAITLNPDQSTQQPQSPIHQRHRYPQRDHNQPVWYGCPITHQLVKGGLTHFHPKFEHIFVVVITFSPFFCANNCYTSLLLIVCALR